MRKREEFTYMALAHHNAAHGDQGRRSETPFFSTKQTGNGNIAASAELTIRLHNDTSTEVVQHQSLVSLGKTKFPGKTGILDTSPSRGTSSTIVSGDEDVISLGLGYTRGDDTDTSLGNQLDGDTGSRIRALEIVDQLLQVFNTVNIVMWWWGDKTDTWCRMTSSGN